MEQDNIFKKIIYNYSTEYNRKKVKEYKKSIENLKMENIKFLCIMGKSGTGKSTLINYLTEKYPNIFNNIKSFTTRKERENDENDKKTHIFVDVNHYLENKKNDKIIAEYKSPNGYYSYSTIDSFCEDKINLYAIDPKAFNEFSKKYSQVYGIYLNIDESERKKRKAKRDCDIKFDNEEHLDITNISVENYMKIDITNIKVEEISDLICQL